MVCSLSVLSENLNPVMNICISHCDRVELFASFINNFNETKYKIVMVSVNIYTPKS